MKSVSTFIAAIILVLSVISIGFFVYYWYKSYLTSYLESVEETSGKEILCTHASIRILRENSYCDSFGNISFYIENTGKVKLSDLSADIYSEKYIGNFKIFDEYGNEIKEIKPNQILKVFVRLNESKKSYTIKIRNNCDAESSLRIKCNWLEGWFYRIPILINNTNSTNLQNVEVNLDTSTLISNAKLRRDCSDIRFTDSDGISLLNYNIRNCNSENTKIWINITIPASSNKTIYLYYGNPNANFPTYYNITPAPPISISIIFPKAWLSGFQYRKSILINNTQNSNNLNDYQILITNPIYNENGLILSYHFNEGSGTIAYDSSGNNNNGNLINGPAWVDGKFGKALQFDGVNDYVISSKGISPPSTFTANIWIYYTGDDGVVVDWLGQNAINTGYHNSGIEIVNGRVKIRYWNLACVDLGSITHNNWYMITIVYDGNNLKGYINGELKGYTSGSLSHPSTLYIALGAADSTNCGDGTYFAGKIDEFRFYNRALSDEEIKALYQAKARLDYGDIRFADENNNLLNYWQEADGKFWVKVNVSANSTKTIYLYYGNPNANSLSNADATMFIYENFTIIPRGSLVGSATYDSTNKWVQLTQNTGGQLGYLYYTKVPTNPIGFYAKFYFWVGGGNGADAMWLGAYDTNYLNTEEDVVNGGYHFTFDEYQDRICFTKSTIGNGNGIACASETTIDNSQWHLAEIYFWYNGSACTKIYYDGNLKVFACDLNVQSNVINGVGQTIFGGRTGGLYNYHRIGNGLLYIVKYIFPEPTISLGAEQSLSNIVEQTYYSY